MVLAGMDDNDDDSWEDVNGSNDDADDDETDGQTESQAVAHARKASAAIKAQALGRTRWYCSPMATSRHDGCSAEDAEDAQAAPEAGEDDELAEYNLDAYDEEEEGARQHVLATCVGYRAWAWADILGRWVAVWHRA